MDEPVLIPKPFFLGVLGTHEQITKQQTDEILIAILHIMERFPEKLILPSEGKSSIFLSDWAQRHSLATQVYEADWQRHAKRAFIFRDTRIMNEATHYVVFLNKRSQTNEKTALRLARKGHCVFTITHSDLSVEQLVIEDPEETETGRNPPSSQRPSRRPAGRGSKRDTGKGPASRQSEQTAVPGTQGRLTDLWAVSPS